MSMGLGWSGPYPSANESQVCAKCRSPCTEGQATEHQPQHDTRYASRKTQLHVRRWTSEAGCQRRRKRTAVPHGKVDEEPEHFLLSGLLAFLLLPFLFPNGVHRVTVWSAAPPSRRSRCSGPFEARLPGRGGVRGNGAIGCCHFLLELDGFVGSRLAGVRVWPMRCLSHVL